MKRYWIWILLVIVLAIIVWGALPRLSSPGIGARRIKNLSYARHLADSAQRFAHDHGGRYPLDLSEITPDFFDPAIWEDSRFFPRDDTAAWSVPRFDWLYFGALFDGKSPPPVLIASPQAFTAGMQNRRIVVLGDLSASIVPEEEYQVLLRKTIEAMRQRLDGAKAE